MSAHTLQFRRSERIRFAVPVKIVPAGTPDAPPLECETLLVNLNGCGVRSAAAVAVGSTVHVRVGSDELPGRVVTCIQASGANAYSIGIKFDRPYFWPVPNPPADWIAHPISKSSQPQRSTAPAV
ncbi:MAG TPA: PilZ domain-containing protein, partial [Terriglobales bacterium]|nr:PilZ domain-containing protein [Terriglobales bacterium]